MRPKIRMMAAAAALAMLGTAAAQQALDLDAGRLAPGMSYGEAREALVDSGWLATGPCDDDGGPASCNPAYPEMEACAGTGEAPCRFRWTRGETVTLPEGARAITVITVGERAKAVRGFSVE